MCHKPCFKWSNFNRKGNRIDWNSIHPKAREFLFTEGTLQQLSEDHSDYARALIEGDDLSAWHSRSEWTAKASASKKEPVKIFNARERAIARMAMTAFSTSTNSMGQQVLRTVKNKDFGFTSKQELERYIALLISSQEGLCAITGIPLQFDGACDDSELLCSLDRIDSDAHYERGNLQVVCRFINMWKSNSADKEFRRLVALLRSTSEWGTSRAVP